MGTLGENDVANLRKRVQRLELLTATLLVSEEAEPFLDDIYFHLLRHGIPDDLHYRELIDDILRAHRRGKDQWRQLEKRLESLEGSVQRWHGAGYEAQHNATMHRIAQVAAEHHALQHDAHHWLVLQSLGIDLAQVPLPRFIQVRVYLAVDNGETTSALVKAVEGMLGALDFGVADDFPARSGSWWKTWFARTKDVLTQPEVQERLAKLERAAELHGLGKPQAEIDKNQAEAVAVLLKSLPKDSDATIQVGSLLIACTARNSDGPCCIQVRTLSQRELIFLENHQDLLSSPKNLLHRLSEIETKDEPAAPRRVIIRKT
jgi:hypothetical protein